MEPKFCAKPARAMIPCAWAKKSAKLFSRRGGDVILEEVYGEGFALPQQP